MQRFSYTSRNSCATLDQEQPGSLRIWACGTQTVKKITYYKIGVESLYSTFPTSRQSTVSGSSSSGGASSSMSSKWEIHRRYSEFLNLRDRLLNFFLTEPQQCPGCRNFAKAILTFEFPKKHMFSSKTPMVINYRAKTLRSFLRLLVSRLFNPKNPKCPSCGGFPFEATKHFLLHDAVTNEDMTLIRESICVEAYTPCRQSTTTGGASHLNNSWTNGYNNSTYSYSTTETSSSNSCAAALPAPPPTHKHLKCPVVIDPIIESHRENDTMMTEDGGDNEEEDSAFESFIASPAIEKMAAKSVQEYNDTVTVRKASTTTNVYMPKKLENEEELPVAADPLDDLWQPWELAGPRA